MSDKQMEKIIEKNYIEVNASGKHKFLMGLLGGLGWGIGITLGTSLFLLLIGFLISKIDFIPIIGQFLANVMQSAQSHYPK